MRRRHGPCSAASWLSRWRQPAAPAPSRNWNRSVTQPAGLRLQSSLSHKGRRWSHLALPAAGTAPAQGILTGKGATMMPQKSPKSSWYLSGVWADRPTRCVSADRDPAGGGEGSPAGPGGGRAAVRPGTAGRGESILVVRWHWLSRGLGWSPCVTGTSWFGLLGVFCFSSHRSGGLALLAAGDTWLPVTPAICSSPGQLLAQAGPSRPRHRAPACCHVGQTVLLTPAGAVSWGPSVRSVSAPSPPGASPSPHHQCMGHPLPTQTGSSCARGRGSKDQPDPWGLCRGPSGTQWLCPPARDSWKPDKPKHPLHPSPVLTPLTSSAALGLNQEQGWLQAQFWELMLSPCPQSACSWRRAAWADSTGGRTWPRCCSAWPPPCAGYCRASLRPAARGTTWSSR